VSHDIKVPWRSRVYDLSNGDKQIHISINGRLSLVLNYDPKTNTLAELPLPEGMHYPVNEIETKILERNPS
jgi:hypothetical protein